MVYTELIVSSPRSPLSHHNSAAQYIQRGSESMHGHAELLLEARSTRCPSVYKWRRTNQQSAFLPKHVFNKEREKKEM